jgi:hypothetical protein
MDDQREMLRHFIATLQYRLKRAAQGAPGAFGEFSAGPEVRKPVELLHHINDMMRFANGRFRAQATQIIAKGSWDEELKIFDLQIGELDHALLELPLKGVVNGKPMTIEQLLQGPLCDAMTHVGQLAMLRRLAGSPVAAENFVRADIRPGRLA